jgi:hypothetical protein
MGSLAAAFYQATPIARSTPTGAVVADQPEDAGARHPILTYSKERNVIVIVLDTFQSDYFAELISDPEIAASMSPGFTFYRNAISSYPSTLFSLQSILTSSTTDKSVALNRWLVQQMRDSVPAKLVRHGYEATLLTWTKQYLGCNHRLFGYLCESHDSMIAQLRDALAGGMQAGATSWDGSAGQPPTRSNPEHDEEIRSILGVASFRLAPHFLKPWIHNGGRWRIPDWPGGDAPADAQLAQVWKGSRRDITIFKALTGQSVAADVPPTFKFLHFYGSHPPSSVGRDCRWNRVEMPRAESLVALISALGREGRSIYRSREIVLDATACMLSLVVEYLSKLDELGVYDKSLIFVVGDHGRLGTTVKPVHAVPSIPGAGIGARGATQSQGVPVFLVKPIGARSALAISDVPVSLCDVPKSIFSQLGIEADYACESVFEVGHPRASPRVFYQSQQRPRSQATSNDRFDSFLVEGHSWLETSWKSGSKRLE